jgi:hypothetical protein
MKKRRYWESEEKKENGFDLKENQEQFSSGCHRY